MSVLGALVGAHSAGETHPIPSDHPDQSDDVVMAMCLAVLAGGAVAGLAAGLRRDWSRALCRPLAAWPRMITDLESPEAPQRPPPQTHPAALQVFLR